MRAAALGSTLALLFGAGCTLAFPLDDLQDGATGSGASGPSTTSLGPTTTNMTSGGGAGQGGATTTSTSSAGGAAAYEDLVLADGPILYFHMDQIATEPNLGSKGSANDGTQDAPSALVPSVLSNNSNSATTYDDPAHDLDMAGEVDTGHLDVPALGSFFDSTQAFTIEIWARLPPENDVETVELARGDEAAGAFHVALKKRAVSDGKDQIVFGFRDAAASIDDYISLCNFDDWVDASARHFVAVFDPVETHALAIYMDGLRCDDKADGFMATGTYDFPTMDPPLTFGNGWSGAVDEIALYGEALTAEKICAHAEAGGAPTCR